MISAAVMALTAAAANPAASFKGPIPPGIYALCHVDSVRTNLPDDRLVEPPFITGVSVRTYWNLIEIHEGVFDWGVFDHTLALAKRHGRAAAFRVMNGTGTPAWVYEAGSSSYEAGAWEGREVGRVPVPWDPVFQAKWRAFVGALARRYDRDPAVAFVAMSMPGGRWVELFHPAALRRHPGYTYEKWRDAHRGVLRAYLDAFQRTPLTLAISGHGPLRDIAGDLARDLTAAAGENSARVYLQANGWSDRGVMGAPDAAIEASFAPIWDLPLRRGFQQIAAAEWARHGDRRLGDQAGANAVLMRLRGEYAEVYDADILNPARHEPLRRLAAALRQSAAPGH